MTSWPGSRPLGKPSKYAPVAEHLRALPAAQQTHVLTFAELEHITGAPLPGGAGSTIFWTGAAARHWKAAGFTARLLRRDRAVEFRREQGE